MDYKDTPHYKHDCSLCQFLYSVIVTGQDGWHDVYLNTHRLTDLDSVFIIRYGNEGHEYITPSACEYRINGVNILARASDNTGIYFTHGEHWPIKKSTKPWRPNPDKPNELGIDNYLFWGVPGKEIDSKHSRDRLKLIKYLDHYYVVIAGPIQLKGTSLDRQRIDIFYQKLSTGLICWGFCLGKEYPADGATALEWIELSMNKDYAFINWKELP